MLQLKKRDETLLYSNKTVYITFVSTNIVWYKAKIMFYFHLTLCEQPNHVKTMIVDKLSAAVTKLVRV